MKSLKWQISSHQYFSYVRHDLTDLSFSSVRNYLTDLTFRASNIWLKMLPSMHKTPNNKSINHSVLEDCVNPQMYENWDICELITKEDCVSDDQMILKEYCPATCDCSKFIVVQFTTSVKIIQ